MTFMITQRNKSIILCLTLLIIVNSHWSRRRQWHPTPVLLPGKSHGRRSLGGWSLWGRKESDTTEWLHFHFSLSCIGEGNGTPPQCSCLKSPRDGGAWRAAVYGVAESDTTEATQQQQQQQCSKLVGTTGALPRSFLLGPCIHCPAAANVSCQWLSGSFFSRIAFGK